VPRSHALATFGAIFYIFLWASAYVPSKIGVLNSSPLWFLVVRFGISGLLALGLALALGAKLPRSPRTWALLVLLGVLNNAVYLGCTYEALRHLATGIGAILASLNPLLLALVAPAVLREPLTRVKGVGLALGFAGVVAIMIFRTGSGTANPGDVALAFTGVIGSVAATVIFKKYVTGVDLRITTGVQLLAAGLVLLPLAFVFEGPPHASWSAPLVVSFVYLIFVISIGASTLWFWLLSQGEASRVSAFYFLTPVFGLALGALLLHEPVGVHDLVGLVAIAFGIFLVQRA
jgi:drug/metabolite transporter (DMT)-like permease